jgi:STE24 endopeptidase
MEPSTARAKAYSSSKRLLSLSSIALSIVFFSAFILTGTSDLLARICFSITQNAYLSAIIFIMIMGAMLELVLFPLSYAGSFRIEHRFGLSRQGIFSWISDYIKGLLLKGALLTAMFAAFYFFLRNFPRPWWVYTGIAYFFVSILVARLFPMLIVPMFYKLTRISDNSLKDRLGRIAQKAGVRILDIYNIGLGAKTTKANAAICGMGKNKRILLSDTMLNGYSRDEIEVTLAHELSHHKRRHFWRLSILNFALTLFALYLVSMAISMLLSYGVITGRDSVLSFPFIAVIFILYDFMISPVTNLISRRYETQADKDAISLTGMPGVFSRLINKLSKQNLSDPSPGRIARIFFYDHPPASERIALAKNIKNI